MIITYIYIQLISPSDKIDCKKKLHLIHAPKFLQTPRMQTNSQQIQKPSLSRGKKGRRDGGKVTILENRGTRKSA